MRLDKLWIKSFKNLNDLNVDFDESSSTTVVVGQNGAGKSNLIEALVIIFRDLDLSEGPSFTYRLEYECRDHHVVVDAEPGRSKGRYLFSVDGAPVTMAAFLPKGDKPYLPANVFGYYSGPSDRLKEYFDKHQDLFYRELLKGNSNAPRPLFYARRIHSQFVLLAFLAAKDQTARTFLEEQMGILDLESVLFVLRQPSWKGPKEGDPRFWQAIGVVSDFLGRAYSLALAPLRMNAPVADGRPKEHLYLFIKDMDRLTELASAYSSQQEFFKQLESTYISELIAEVRIKVRVKGADQALTFRELAEGEQQLLTVLGLLRFTKEDESLFLLDEPDTHLNPLWSYEYLAMIKRLVGDNPKSHVIMSTHDPLVFAGLKKEQVQIMSRHPVTGVVSAECPITDPKGMGIQAILTSDMFGLRTTLDRDTLALLDERFKLIGKGSDRSVKDNARLDELSRVLSNLGFATEFTDPNYEQYARAMAAARKKLVPKEDGDHDWEAKAIEIAERLIQGDKL